MTSRSKKRRGSRKKKETGTPNTNNPGDDEVNSPDSDGEEFGTPALDFHQSVFENSEFSTPAVDFHQTPFQEGGGEDLEKTGSSSVKSSKQSHTSSSSSSSDDESRADEKNGKGASSFGDLVAKEVGKLGEVGTLGGDALVSDVVKPVVSVSVEVTQVKEYAPIETSSTSDPFRPVLKENGENLLAKFNELTGASPAEVGSQTSNNGEASSNTVKFAPKDSEGKAVLSSGHAKNSETPQNSKNEPLLSVAPRPVQTTSWKSCCGLFEVLTGSHR